MLTIGTPALTPTQRRKDSEKAGPPPLAKDDNKKLSGDGRGRSRQGFADDGGYAGAEEFDGVHHFVVGEGGYGHLEGEAGDAAEGFVDVEEFGGYGFGVADDEGSGGAAEGVELAAGGWGPAALFADLGEGLGVAGEEVVGGLLVGVGEEADGVDADFEFFGGVAGAGAGFAVEVDEGTEAVGLAADDGDHEGQAEHAGADEGLGRAAYSEPDGERVLEGARVDALSGERGRDVCRTSGCWWCRGF